MKNVWYAVMGLMIFGIAANPQSAADNASFALSLCGTVIIPSLLPFLFCSGILVSLDFADFAGKPLNKIMRPVFNVPGKAALALIIGIISGYPVGASVVAELYKNGCCTKTEGERMLTFCNNSGPLFIIGAVGAGMFNNVHIGNLLYLSHVTAAISVGIIFAFYKKNQSTFSAYSPAVSSKSMNIGVCITESVTKSVSTMLNICGFVIIFYVSGRLLSEYKIIAWITGLVLDGTQQKTASELILGMAEMSTGLKNTVSASFLSLTAKIIFSSFLLGFAGISVYFQTMGMTADTDLSLKPYLAGKLLHGLISSAISFTFIRLMPEATLTLAEQAPTIAHNTSAFNFKPLIGNYTIFSVGLCAVLITATFLKTSIILKNVHKHNKN